MSSFVDRAQLHAKAGDGGAGSVSFRREAHVPEGGPDGGDGGRGGDVWIEADLNVSSLLAFRDHPFRSATSGAHGAGKKRHGSSGHDVTVKVPVGTVVADLDGEVLVDLVGHGDRFRVAEGGKGGHGNAKFLSNTRRAPAFAEQGERGEERWCNLELKLMADVALVGFPNVGKSTLISAVSAARPKVADYPFTTLEPHLGVVRWPLAGEPKAEFTMADIPGLIEGAADGKGLGLEFLRHIERARVLLFLLDLAPYDQTPPAVQLEVLRHELGTYLPELLDRPSIVVGSKADLVDGEEDQFEGLDLVISAATHQGLQPLVGELVRLVDSMRQVEAELAAEAETIIHRPLPEQAQIVDDGHGGWLMLGRAAARAVGLSDLSNPAAMDEVVRRLEKLGVDRLLNRAGARDGDQVTIGDFSFTWYRAGSAAAMDAQADAEGPSRRKTKRERSK